MDRVEATISRAMFLKERGYSNAEIASQMRCSERAIRGLLSAGRKNNSSFNETTKGANVEELVKAVEKTDIDLPIPHQLGKLLTGVIVGFGATKLAEKAYVSILMAYRARHGSSA
jgi:hypothetical protein